MKRPFEKETNRDLELVLDVMCSSYFVFLDLFVLSFIISFLSFSFHQSLLYSILWFCFIYLIGSGVYMLLYYMIKKDLPKK
ncbi:hypothetical protein LS684_12695 [Cytobacillus spongiae]|uniref:hypothetical protein n=1 Tax=Cytobacillus spongiae TaxID=2901381 RepID=UPI001F468A82|nr:hypothetical protein [Cytobacillus spongiae]UII54529.1 hypothetical protein LS684_12695 [Cytobacillus spongiae]